MRRQLPRRTRPARRKCLTKFCRNEPRLGRKNSLCSKCDSRRFKELHPLKYAFNLLRCGAKRRNVEFKLTYAEYELFSKTTGYAEGRARKADGLTIDRIDPLKPYQIDNIRCISMSDNSSKGVYSDKQAYAAQRKAELDEACSCGECEECAPAGIAAAIDNVEPADCPF